MNINIQELQTYLDCPRLYALKQECRLPKQTYSSIDEKYIMELRRMIYFFFNQMKYNGYCNFNDIKREWGKLWVGKRRRKDLLIPVENKVRLWHRKRERDGLDVLFRLHKSFSEDNADIVAVNMPFNVAITKDVNLTGRWPLIRVMNNKTELIDFRHKDEIGSTESDIILTAISYAFRNQFNSTEDKLCIYDLDKGKLITTTRSSKDYSILKDTIDDFTVLIKTGRFIRVMSKQCDKCTYSFLCKGVSK